MVMAFVHPAAVVPVAWIASRVGRTRRVGGAVDVKAGVDGAALVCGSVGPDVVDYFVRMSARPKIHVDVAPLLGAGVVGAIALFACVLVAGPGLVRALPPFFASRFGPSLARPWRERRVFVVVISLAVGLLTHIAWDAVTEKHGLAHQLAPGLVPFRALYMPTTVLGVLVLVVGIATAPRGGDDVATFSAGALVGAVTSSLAGAVLFAVVRAMVFAGSTPDAMAAASTGAIAGVVVAGLMLRLRPAKQPGSGI